MNTRHLFCNNLTRLSFFIVLYLNQIKIYQIRFASVFIVFRNECFVTNKPNEEERSLRCTKFAKERSLWEWKETQRRPFYIVLVWTMPFVLSRVGRRTYFNLSFVGISRGEGRRVEVLTFLISECIFQPTRSFESGSRYSFLGWATSPPENPNLVVGLTPHAKTNDERFWIIAAVDSEIFGSRQISSDRKVCVAKKLFSRQEDLRWHTHRR